jgi:hypothetical protein
LLRPQSVRQLDTTHDEAGIWVGIEAEHAGTSSFNGAMILLADVVQILAAAYFHFHPFGVLPAQVSQSEVARPVPIERLFFGQL